MTPILNALDSIRKFLRRLAAATLMIALCAGLALGRAAAPATPKTGDGPRLLFNGRTLAGWVPEGGANWHVGDGVIVADDGEDGWLRSEANDADFVLDLEYRNPSKGNRGIFLRAAKGGDPYPAPANGDELQLCNEGPQYATGSIEDDIQRLKPTNPAPGQWHHVVIEARGPHFVVRLDGEKILDGMSAKFSSGYVGLQYHKGSKIEFRNITIAPTQGD